jgi:hypothetical protein
VKKTNKGSHALLHAFFTSTMDGSFDYYARRESVPCSHLMGESRTDLDAPEKRKISASARKLNPDCAVVHPVKGVIHRLSYLGYLSDAKSKITYYYNKQFHNSLISDQ